MQKLLVELKNTQGAPPQVPCYCYISVAFNREETLSVLVLANNNSEEDLHSGKSRQDLRVPVINMHMKPCLPDSARNSEKVELPAGSDWIKIIIFKEVKRAIPPPIEMVGLLAQLL